MNPLFNAFGGGRGLPSQAQNFVKQFRQFAQGMSGDPRQQVQQMLNSGKVSQAQYNQAVSLANQIAPMMGIKK